MNQRKTPLLLPPVAPFLGETVVVIPIQKSQDEFVQDLGHRWREGARIDERIFQHAALDFLERFSVERKPAGHRLVQNDAEAPHV